MNIKDLFNFKEMNKNQKIVTISVMAAIVIAIVVLIVVLATGGDDESNDDAATETKAPVETKAPEQTDEPTPSATAVPEATKTAQPTNTPFPAGVNRLTGEPMDEEIAAKRPIAIMVNNIKEALPQSGISEADIVYECNAEGGITRLMCIFQNPTGDRIGSVRSVRHYYASFASEYDAIFCSVGGSTAGIEKLEELNMDYINGINKNLTYRDKSQRAPHNAYTSVELLNKCIKNGKFRTEFKGRDDNHFTFYNKDTILTAGVQANKVSIKMSGYSTPYFEYKDGLYYRYQFGRKHIDAVNNKQLCFKNVLVMYVIQNRMDDYGRQDMVIEDNSGEGYYITNGKAVPITWTKNEKAGTMQFLDKDGKLLSVNKGKTCIMVVPNTLVEGTKFE